MRPAGLRDASQRVRVRVPGKVNLALAVGARRADGYHSLATVFQAVSLYDEVVAVSCADRISLRVSGEQVADVPSGPDNLAWRAAELLRDRYGAPEMGAELNLMKAIPVAGGMAGGSADAAGALLACSVLWDLEVTGAQLHALATELGSDVPFALLGGTALGRGRGEELVPLLTRGVYHWVFAVSQVGLSTPAVFTRFDELVAHPGPLAVSDELLNALARGQIEQVAAELANDLQAAALDLRPELRPLLLSGLNAGALGAVLSGSGPTIAFLCATQRAAQGVAEHLSDTDGLRAVRYARGPAPGAQIAAPGD